MSFWKKLFGRNESDKPRQWRERDSRNATNQPGSAPPPLPSIDQLGKTGSQPQPQQNNQFVPGHSREQERTLYSHVPANWPAPTLNKTTNLLRIDAIMVLAQYTADKNLGLKQDSLLFHKLTDEDPFVIPLVLRDDNGLRYPIFFFYDEAEAQRFAGYRAHLAAEGDWGEAAWFSVFDLQELPTVTDQSTGEKNDFIDFTATLKLEKDYQAPNGNYALWWRDIDESFYAKSPELTILEDCLFTSAGKESLLLGMLMAQLHKKPFEGRIGLPDTRKELALIGPEEKPVILLLDPERGMLFLFPISTTDATYRRRFLTVYRNWAKTVIGYLENNQQGLQLDPRPPYGYPIEWFKRMKLRLTNENPGAEQLMPLKIGEVPDYVPPSLESEKIIHTGTYNMDIIFPRLITETSPKTANTGINLEKKAPQFSLPFIGCLRLAFGIDEGSHFVHLTEKQFFNLPLEDADELAEIAIQNMMKSLEGEVQLKGNPEEVMVLQAGGNFEACFLLVDQFWEKIDEVIGGDVVAAVPTTGSLLISRLTNPAGMDKIREGIAHFQQVASHPILSNEIYYRQLGGQWSVVDA